MNRHGFSLEKVLAYRRLREEQYLRRLAEAYRRQRLVEDQLTACRREIMQEQQRSGAGRFKLEEWLHRGAYLEMLSLRFRELQETLAQLKAETEQLEEQTTRATQEREILDKLKGKRVALAEYEARRLEQREMDEQALLRLTGD